MGRLIGKFFSQALLLLGPIITLNWSFLNLLGYSGAPTDNVSVNFGLWTWTGEKQQVELKIRVLVTVLGLAWVFGTEIFEHLIPRRDFKEFRMLYLKHAALPKWRASLHGDVRINIMHTWRLARFLWLIPVFRWTWNDGFVPPDRHHDANLFLTKYQGVAGNAFRARTPQYVDFRELAGRSLKWYEKWLPFNQFRLMPWQLKKVREVKAVLSVPILKEMKGNSPRWRPVGVINLDSTTDEGANFLRENRGKLANSFTDDGKILACLK